MSNSASLNTLPQTFDVSRYLQRIKVDTPQSLDIDTLTTLQRAHLKAIPFENLDIHYGKTITLDLECAFEKVIVKRRGGFCYELNGLFHTLLTNLGFNAKLVSARVSRPDGSYGLEFGHLAIVVSIEDEKYLADVGFGRFAFSPILIPQGTGSSFKQSDYRIDRQADDSFLVSRLEDGTSYPEYVFTPIERRLPDFQAMCEYHQTSPESNFTKNKVISIVTDHGRKTLTDTQLKTPSVDGISTLNLAPEDFELHLKQEFGIVL